MVSCIADLTSGGTAGRSPGFRGPEPSDLAVHQPVPSFSDNGKFVRFQSSGGTASWNRGSPGA
jgi:hypothetical protein